MIAEQKVKNKINHYTVLLRHPHYSKKKTFLDHLLPSVYYSRMKDREYIEGMIKAFEDVLEVGTIQRGNDFGHEKEESLEYWEERLAPYRKK